MAAPSYLSTPDVQFLLRVVQELSQGALLVPRFQRRALIWDVDERIELLRSVRMGIPIGAVFVWRTNSTLATYDTLGPYRLEPAAEGSLKQYLLDGLQRLSTLLAALTPRTAELDSQDEDFVTFFDFEQDDFRVEKPSTPVKPCWLRLPDLVDSIRLRRAHRSFPDEHADAWIERSDELFGAFNDYKLAIIPLVGDDFGRAVETFQRINRPGARMTYVHMANARTWSPSFSLNDSLEEFRDTELRPLGWGDLSEDAIMGACKVNLGLQLYDKDAGPLSERLKQDPTELTRSFSAVLEAIRFLRDHCGVKGPGTLPYQHQLTLVAEALHVASADALGIDDTLTPLLVDWFWVTSIGETFRGISGYRFDNLVEAVRTMVRERRRVWPDSIGLSREPLVATTGWSAVRPRVVALRLAMLQGAEQELAARGKDAFVSMIPRKLFIKGTQYGALGNRFVTTSPVDLQTELADLAEGSAPAPGFLDKHVIGPIALEALRGLNYDLFVNLRLADLNRFEAEFVDAKISAFGAARE
jgi:Protein of unknown function DUF262